MIKKQYILVALSCALILLYFFALSTYCNCAKIDRLIKNNWELLFTTGRGRSLHASSVHSRPKDSDFLLLKSLGTTQLSTAMINADSLDAIAQITSLEKLSIDNRRYLGAVNKDDRITKGDLNKLSDLENLRSIKLYDVLPKGYMEKQFFTNLQMLREFGGNVQFDNEDIISLTHAPSLHRISGDFSKIDMPYWDRLLALKSLEEIKIIFFAFEKIESFTRNYSNNNNNIGKFRLELSFVDITFPEDYTFGINNLSINIASFERCRISSSTMLRLINDNDIDSVSLKCCTIKCIDKNIFLPDSQYQDNRLNIELFNHRIIH